MQMRPALGHIMLLDVLDGGADYRYRVYGSEIAQRAGFDMTGKCTSELPTGSLASLFFIAVYQAVLLRPEPVYTWHQMPVDITVNTWHRLVLPLHGPDGTIRSEEHTSELQSLMRNSYAVLCLKKKKPNQEK